MRIALAVALMLTLAACGASDEAPAGGISRDEARQLDEAAAKTDINAVFAEDNAAEAAE